MRIDNIDDSEKLAHKSSCESVDAVSSRTDALINHYKASSKRAALSFVPSWTFQILSISFYTIVYLTYDGRGFFKRLVYT